MRISSSLLLILAALTAANASVVESATHPRHSSLRVKNDNVKVNALDTAKVKVHPELKDLKNLVKVASKRDIDVQANNDAAHVKANLARVDLKHVAGIVHTLSATLESQNKEADSVLKTEDHKLAAVQAEKLLGTVTASLAHAVADIHGLTTAGAHVSVHKRHKPASTDVKLETVISLINGNSIAGSACLVSLLSGIQASTALKADAVSVISNVDLIQTVHDVVGIDTVLKAVVGVVDAVPLVQAFQKLESPVAFVSALVHIKSIPSLVASACGGVESIAKVEGSAKLVSYIHEFGISTVTRILTVSGVENVLTALVAVPGSVRLFGSIKTVTDVPALISGLHVLNVASFVSSIKAVHDVSLLTSVLSVGTSVGLCKRDERLQGVDATVAGLTGLGLSAVVSLKRSLAHIAALPDSDLEAIEEKLKLKRDVDVDVDVEDVLSHLDAERVSLLKRSIADLAGLEQDGLSSGLKHDLVSGLPLGGVARESGSLDTVHGTVEGVLPGAMGAVDGVEKIKRDVLAVHSDSASTSTRIENSIGETESHLDLNRILSIVKRSDLASIQGSVSNLDVAKILPSLKRAIVNANIASVTLGASAADVSLLSDSINTLSVDVSSLFPKLVSIADTVEEDRVTGDIQTKVAPLVISVGKVLDRIVSVQAPTLSKSVDQVINIATNTIADLD